MKIHLYILITILSSIFLSAADEVFIGAGGDNLWTNPTNWQNSVVPNNSTTGAILWNDDLNLLIEDGINAVCHGFMLGAYGSTNSAQITGGSLNCTWLNVGRANQNGGDGTLYVSGGTINVSSQLTIPTQFNTLVDPEKLGRGRLELTGGIINAQDLHIGSGSIGNNGGIGELFITDGVLTLQGNKVSKIQNFINSGYITTENARTLEVEYNTIYSGRTSLISVLSYPIEDINYTGNGSDDFWFTANNWENDVIPDNVYTGAAFKGDGLLVIIENGQTVTCRGFMLGMYGTSNRAEVNGGIVNCEWLDAGRCDANGGSGNLVVNNGLVVINQNLSIPNQFSTLTDSNNIGYGRVELRGGQIQAANLIMGNGGIGEGGGTGELIISEGQLIIDGDATSVIQSYIDQGFITAEGFRNLVLEYNSANANRTYLYAVNAFSGIPDNPYPNNAGTYYNAIENLFWSPVPGTEQYKVYFGESLDPPLFRTVSGTVEGLPLTDLTDNTTYYWRVEAIREGAINASPTWSFTIGDRQSNAVAPPYTDYCEMLSQEIQGKKHGFLAGNRTYYIGGFHPSWSVAENETIGFTHPFHNDLRSRGYGMVQQADTGYGHDFSGWEFYKHTKIAYGTVIINGVRYENPVPTAMYWRPDRMICEYNVGGVAIREDKFIALNDVACSNITSDAAIQIEFSGQSFYKDGVSVSTTATCNFDAGNNLVEIVEGGVNLVKPLPDLSVEGVMMYDGMSTILSTSNPIFGFSKTTESTGQQKYVFSTNCDSNGVSIVWSMNDDTTVARNRAASVLADASGELQNKTDHMNTLLNDQIPYFRCSDQAITEVYYFLWAIYLMYTIDLSDESPDFYPHTQSAVNNFLGLHRYDSAIQIPVGSWIVNKEQYAYGNALRWKTMLPYANLENGRIPADNLGKTWYSGLWGGVTSHVPGVWKIYQHSGDLNFLAEAYDFYRQLMWNAVPGFWGQQYFAADCLRDIAEILGYPQSEIDRWNDLVNYDNIQNWFNYAFTIHGYDNFFSFGAEKGWTAFGYMLTKEFPKDKARAMVETYAVDGPNGFITNDLFAVAPRDRWDTILIPQTFFITPDTNYFLQMGMYAVDLEEYANRIAIDHLKKYNYNWGVPCAPEAMGNDYEFAGDQYSNFNAGKILVILEGIFGLSYSVVEDEFTVADNLPREWSFMESYVPIKEGTNTVNWVRTMVTREDVSGKTVKRIKVENNPLSELNINPWLEQKSVLSVPDGFSSDNSDLGHAAYLFTDQDTVSLELNLTEGSMSSVINDSFQFSLDQSQAGSEVDIRFSLAQGDEPFTAHLEKSTILDMNQMSDMYRYSNTNGTEYIADGVEVQNDNNYFIINEAITDSENIFYRLRVEN